MALTPGVELSGVRPPEISLRLLHGWSSACDQTHA